MEELKKIRRVLERQNVAHVRTLLVLDASTGQNAIVQGRAFKEATGLDGLVLAKLDGTAKGGVVFAIVDELEVPVLFVGHRREARRPVGIRRRGVRAGTIQGD